METPKAAQKGHGKCPSCKVRCAAMHIQLRNLTPVLKKDTKSHWLGRDNVGYAMIKGNQMLVLLDMGANVNMITPECVAALGLQVGPLMDLCEEGITVDQPFNYEGQPIGYVVMRVQIDGISSYDEDQVVLIAQSSAKFAHRVPIILGMPTTDQTIATLKESEIVLGTMYLNYSSFSGNYLLSRLIPKVPAGTQIGQHMCDTHLPLPTQLCLLVANRHLQD